ncbi:MAG: sulfate adenylyltransferase subunit 1 [Bacteroidales bacterium]
MTHTEGYLDMELLRFSTAGSVDDGKSTLIGRLLYDSKSIFEDQLEAVEADSRRRGNEELNLALLTDGLKAEREQGITIDVAYRYFATPKRKFIIADTPGHIQYTRNMVTGASTADLAIILIDARNGIIEQTIRHSYIASLLQIPHIVVCVNKMDLVGFSQERFREIADGYRKIAGELGLKDVLFVPISAKFGDNVVEPSLQTPWYEGPTLLNCLENAPIDHKINAKEARFPVQYVIRPISDKFHDYRAYAGRMAGGSFSKGDAVVVWPSGQRSVISEIYRAETPVETALSPESVSIRLKDDIDISRGDMLVKESQPAPQISQEITMMVCWFNATPLQARKRYLIRHTTAETKAVVQSIAYAVNIQTLGREADVSALAMNDIGEITIRTAKPLVYDAYSHNRFTGSLIFIDEFTFETVGAGMIL